MDLTKTFTSIIKNNTLRVSSIIVWVMLAIVFTSQNIMPKNQQDGLLTVLFGLGGLIWFRLNGTKIVLKRGFFRKKTEEEIKKEIKLAQIGYIIGGILFIIIGLSKIVAN